MGTIRDDLKYVLRRLGRAPGFTAITLVTLALGIGANSAIFSVVRGVLLKPLAYPDPDQLVGVWLSAPGVGWKEVPASPSSYFTFREESHTFQDIGLYRDDSVSVIGVAEPEQVDCLFVTDGLLPILGVRPYLGRTFTRKDDSPGSPETVMLAYGYWQRRFGGNTSVIGRRVVIDGKAREVIGVLPQQFRFMNSKAALLLPFQFDRSKAFIGNFSYQAVARLKPGISIAQANADVGRMITILFRKFPPFPGVSLEMFKSMRLAPNLRSLKQDVVGDVGKVLWVLMGVVGIVLFIACANVANLLLVRAEGRQQELAIRAALGAGWGQIARGLLLESVTLGVIGGLIGLGLAYAALRLLVAMGPANLPRLDEISIDVPVLLFTLGVSILAGVLFGLVPVFKYAGSRLGTALREGGRTLSEGRERHRARSALVVVQVALALVLLISSGLMIRTFQAMRRVQPGFTDPEKILTFGIFIPETQVPDPERVVRMQQDMVSRLEAVPGVTSVGLSTSITMDGNNDNDPVFVEDHPIPQGQIPPLRRYKFISPGYFKTMGNPLLAGRDLTWTDIYQGRPVALISENLARQYWRDPVQALGKRIRNTPQGIWRQIIGVVGNERDNGVGEKAPLTAYWPMMVKKFWVDPVEIQRSMAFAIRSNRSGSANFLDEVRHTVWSVNPNVPLADVRTVKQIYDKSMARTSFTLVMLGIAAAMALLLGLVGIYGVISYAVTQRTREIGIRMALGARQEIVMGMFVRHGLVLATIGVVSGLAAAMALTRLMKALLFEISPLDPITYCAVPAVLVTAALLASYVPARHATAIDPVDALRVE